MLWKFWKHGVGRALVPVLVDALHGRNHLDVLAQLGREDVPAVADVADQFQRLVLCQDEDSPDVGIDAVGEREIDDPVDAAEWHGGLAVPR